MRIPILKLIFICISCGGKKKQKKKIKTRSINKILNGKFVGWLGTRADDKTMFSSIKILNIMYNKKVLKVYSCLKVEDGVCLFVYI